MVRSLLPGWKGAGVGCVSTLMNSPNLSWWTEKVPELHAYQVDVVLCHNAQFVRIFALSINPD
jgi:hypothetical protein